MKKRLTILLSGLLLLGLVGCGGSETYQPKEVAQLGTLYRSTDYKEANGQNAIINVAKVEKRDGDLVISIEAPTHKQLSYAVDEFLFVNPLDEKGESLTFDKYVLNYINTDEVESEIVVKGIENFDTVKWIEIGPYKTKDENTLVFEVK